MPSSMFLSFKRFLISKLEREINRWFGTGNEGGFECLPDDLVVEILKRLPAEDLWWRCQKVCKRWYAIISPPSFAHAHLRQSPSTFFVCRPSRVMSFNLAIKPALIFAPDGDDANASGFVAWSLNERWNFCGRAVLPLASCNGLILFSYSWSSGASSLLSTELFMRNLSLLSTTYRIDSHNQICIGNPITGEIITIHSPSRITLHGLCGFFYHSSTQEYKLLHCHKSGDADMNYVYAMLTLGSTEWRSLCNFPHRVRWRSSPVILDNTLYWMARVSSSACEDSIITFNMDSEQFRTMPHPSYLCQTNDKSHDRMHLLEVDGRLTCWCLLGDHVRAWDVDVSNGDNYSPASWVQIYHLDFKKSFQPNFKRVPDNYHVKLVSIQNRELVLLWGKRVFCYDLLTDRVLKEISIGEVNEVLGLFTSYHLLITRYTKSLIPVDNFYPGLSEIQVA